MSLQLFYQLLVSGVVIGSTYALLGVSFGVIYSTTRTFHLAHSVVYALAAYGAVVGVRSLDLPLAIAALLGLAVAVITGLVIEFIAYKPMRARDATVLAVFLVSLGLTIAAPNLLEIVFGPENRALPGFPIETIQVGTVTFTTLDVTSVIVSWLAIAGVLAFLARTKYGRAVNATRTNPQMAMAVGVPVQQVYLIVFAIGSVLAGIAALLFTMGGVANPTMGLTPVLIGFIAVFLGGIGSTLGAAFGGLALGLAMSLSGLWLTGDFALAVVFGFMFVLLIIRPQGLLGKATV